MSAAACVTAPVRDSTTNENLFSFCKRLPKVELHAHLNGSISAATMQKLLKKYADKISQCAEGEGTAIPELWQTTIAKGERRTLDEGDSKGDSSPAQGPKYFRCFSMFKIIHTVVDDEEAVAMAAHDVVEDFSADGVVYLELRSTPRANPITGMTKRSYVDAVLKGIDNAIHDCQSLIYVRLLLSIDRRQSIAEASNTVQLAIDYSGNISSGHHAKVVGIDLSGDPQSGNMMELLPVLKSAKQNGLKLTLHIAEIPNRNEETKVLLGAKPDRIGHGTFLLPDVGGTEEIVDLVMQQKIPIELCLTSNVKGQTVSSYENHQLGFWKKRNHPVTISTDDKGVFEISLTDEYYIAAQTFSLSVDELWTMSQESVDFIFEDEPLKAELRKLWKN